MSFVQLVRKQRNSLRYAAPEERQSYDFVVRAVSGNGLSLSYAELKWRANGHVVLAALRNNPRWALVFVAVTPLMM